MYNYYGEPQFYDWDEREYPEMYPQYRMISMQEAMNIALGRVPGQVTKIELEREHGRMIYEVDIITAQGVKYEVEVDSNTGQILRVELD